MKSQTISKWVERPFLIIMFSVALLYVAAMLYLIPYRPCDNCPALAQFLLRFPVTRRWDVMFLPGVIVLPVVIILSRNLKNEFDEMFARLVRRDALVGETRVVKARIDRHAAIWSGAVGLAIGMIVAGLMVNEWLNEHFQYLTKSLQYLGLTAIGLIGGGLVGMRFGRMILYGRFGWILEASNIDLKIQVGHPDGIGGLKPIAQFYFYQATLLFIPILYLGLGWLIMPDSPYDDWRPMFGFLFIIAVMVQIAAFFVPLWGFHHDIKRQKAQLAEEAEQIGQNLITLKSQLSIDQPLDPIETVALTNRITALTQRFTAMQQLPTIPLEEDIRRRFTIRSVAAIFVPLLGEYVRVSAEVQSLLDALLKLLD